METYININKDNFQGINTFIENVELNGEKVLRVIKSEKIMEFDENTYAKLTDVSFHNGIIEVKVLSRLLENAPDFARGFIGIAFRINNDDTKFESFYLRPTNGRIDDPIRKARGCQYFSYPNYTFEYFRDKNIKDYEAPANIGLNEWIKIKAVIEGNYAEFYINHEKEPLLVVKDMKQGGNNSGKIGFFVDIGTEAFFKDLKITLKE